MNQRQLSYFLEVYNRKNISQAAEALFISPQGLSKTISALEKELNLELFEHHGNQIIPTQAATNLVSHAKSFLSEYEIITEKKFCCASAQKKLLIGCSYDALQNIPITFFQEFYKNHPEILLSIQEFPDRYILERLDNNEIELAILPGPFNVEIYHVDSLFTNHFCLVLNKNHPLATKPFLSLIDLKDQPLAIKGKNYLLSEFQYNECRKEGFNPNVVFETSDSHLIHQMAENGFAVGMTLDYLAEKIHSDNVVVRRFHESWLTKTVYITHKNDLVLSPEAALFKDKLLNFFR